MCYARPILRASFLPPALSLILWPTVALAQSESGALLSGSGTLVGSVARLTEALGQGTASARVDLLLPIAKEQALMLDVRRLRERSVATRRQCGADLRASNRDTRLRTLLRCVRSVLLTEQALRERQRQRIEGAPGVQGSVRDDALGELGRFRDALQAVVSAMDTGLFQDDATLEDTLLRLHAQYRLPMLKRLRQWEAERSIAWMRLIVLRVTQISEDPSLSGNAEEALHDAVLCLEEDHALLLDILRETNNVLIDDLFLSHRAMLPICTAQLRAAIRLHDAEPTGSGTLLPGPAFMLRSLHAGSRCCP